GMFFGALRPDRTFRDEGQDDQREGHIVTISAATDDVRGVTALLPSPFSHVGSASASNGSILPFVHTIDGAGEAAGPPVNPEQNYRTDNGLFVNQLQSISIHPINGYAYVLSIPASPNGPVRFASNNTSLVSVFDTTSLNEVRIEQTSTEET